MRSTAICAAFCSFFLSLGLVHAGNVPAGGRNVEPKTNPNENPQVQTGTATFTVTGVAVGQAQAVPAQGFQLQAVPAQVQAGQGTITVTAGGPIAVGGAMAAPAGSISIDANGTRQAQNEEFGLKVKITDDPQKGIKIEQTTHKGGTDETKSFEAKDAKELEKKSPEAFKLYQKYLGNQGQVQAGAIQVQGFAQAVPLQIQGGGQLQLGGPMPVPFPMPGAGGAVIPQAVPAGGGGVQVIQAQAALAPAGGMPIEIATQLMSNLSNEIESAAKNSAWKDASKDERSAIKKQAEELKKRLGQLEKELEEK